MDFGTHSCARHSSHVHRVPKKCGAQASFPAFWWVKPALLAQTQVETFTINTNLPHSEFRGVQEEDISRASEEFISSP